MSAAHVPHVLLVPVPFQGHINPFTSMAHFFAAADISVTLVLYTRSHSLLSSSASAETENACMSGSRGSIHTKVIPDFASADAKLNLETLKASTPIMCTGLENLLQELMQEENPPCCLIADGFLPWCHDVALKFQLPRVEVCTGCASMFALCFHIPELLARGYIPAIDEESKKKTVEFIPGLSPVWVADLPKSIQAEKGLQAPDCELVRSATENSRSADRILVNTMNELESSVLEGLRTEGNVCIDAVGPLFMMSSISVTHPSLLQEDNSCLAWLDRQHKSSVLYMSFGSIATIEEDVFKELAHGVEASGVSFLWVIRPDAHKDKARTPDELLPEGFMQRTRGRGLVISWAPQLAVLEHASVAAFLTHCGWNSVLESLSNGIAMLGFPQQSEQKANLKFIVHDWGVGLPLLRTDARRVERTDVQRAVNAITKGVEGREVRKRAREWRDIAHKAAHGSSKINLQRLVDDLKHGHLKPMKA